MKSLLFALLLLQTPEINALRERAKQGDVQAQYDLGKIYDRWTQNGRFTEKDDLEYYEVATRESPEIGNIPWAEAAEQGCIPIQGLGPFRTHTNFCSDYEPGKTNYSPVRRCRLETESRA